MIYPNIGSFEAYASSLSLLKTEIYLTEPLLNGDAF